MWFGQKQQLLPVLGLWNHFKSLRQFSRLEWFHHNANFFICWNNFGVHGLIQWSYRIFYPCVFWKQMSTTARRVRPSPHPTLVWAPRSKLYCVFVGVVESVITNPWHTTQIYHKQMITSGKQSTETCHVFMQLNVIQARWNRMCGQTCSLQAFSFF